MASSPTVTFNLRNVVGMPRGDAAAYSPAPRQFGNDDAHDDPPAFGRLSSVVRARTESTREQSEQRFPAPLPLDQHRPVVFKYSSAAGHHAMGGLRPAAVRSPSPGDKAPYGPTADEVALRFREMDVDTELCNVPRRAPQVVQSGDYAAGANPSALLGGPRPAATFNYNRAGGAAVPGLSNFYSSRPSGGAAARGQFLQAHDGAFGQLTRSVVPDDEPYSSEYDAADEDQYAGGPEYDDQVGAAHGAYGSADSAAEPFDDDAPIVPAELLRGEVKEDPWEDHPASSVLLALLERRGVKPPQFMELIRYHMASTFLDFISILLGGSYFIRFGTKGTAPKERFVRLRTLPDEVGRPTPTIVITIHRDAVQIIDRIRLEDLVGITRGVDGPAFRRHLIHADVIKGSFVGQHRARLSTKGAFSLWFYDRRTRQPKALDLLTTNLNVLEVWTRCMEGVLSVNSVCIHRTNIAQEMQRLFKLAQNAAEEEFMDD
jgi:hypothetical protein